MKFIEEIMPNPHLNNLEAEVTKMSSKPAAQWICCSSNGNGSRLLNRYIVLYAKVSEIDSQTYEIEAEKPLPEGKTFEQFVQSINSSLRLQTIISDLLNLRRDVKEGKLTNPAEIISLVNGLSSKVYEQQLQNSQVN